MLLLTAITESLWFQDVLVLSRDGDNICVAQKSSYHLVNARTKHVLDLFPFDPEFTHPIVKRIGPNEVCVIHVILIIFVLVIISRLMCH